jgi:hypothetical protein
MPNAQPWTNVIHARFTGGASSPGPTDLTALDALLVRFWVGTAFGAGAAWLANCPPLTTLTKISYVPLDGSSLGTEITRSLVGTGSTSALPSECAPVLTIRSAQRGRSHRGRIYLPAPSTASIIATDGTLITTVITNTIAQWNGLVNALGGAAVSPFWELGVASYKYHYYTPVASATMDKYIDVQRRRKK